MNRQSHTNISQWLPSLSWWGLVCLVLGGIYTFSLIFVAYTKHTLLAVDHYLIAGILWTLMVFLAGLIFGISAGALHTLYIHLKNRKQH